MLEELPETLDETYERTLREINKANREHAHRLLQCLAAAVCPLRIAELAEVLTIDFEAASSGDIEVEDGLAVGGSRARCSLSVFEFDRGCRRRWVSSRTILSLFCERVPGFGTRYLKCRRADVSRFHILPEPAHMILAKAAWALCCG